MKSQSPPWIHLSLFFVSLCISQTHQTQISYHDHCASIVPEATSLHESSTFSSSFPLKAYFNGGDGLFNQNPSTYSRYSENSFEFQNWVVLRTSIEGVFKVETSLSFQTLGVFQYIRNFTIKPRKRSRSSITISLEGFWSESSGKLCMVGSGSGSGFGRDAGKVFDLSSVLKLNNLKISVDTTLDSLVTGTLESLSDVIDPTHFGEVSILIFPHSNYKFTLVSKDFHDGFSWGSHNHLALPLTSVSPNGFCSMFSGIFSSFNLKYSSNCEDYSKNCSLFGDGIGYLPNTMSLKLHHCVENGKKLQLFLQFSNNSFYSYSQSFDPSTSLIGEGSWDEEKNSLDIAACRISNATQSWANARIEDCSIKLSFEYLSVLSIRESKNIMGQIWSSSGYFGSIKFYSSNRMIQFPGLKYEYTEIERAKKTCSKRVKIIGKRFPNADTSDMRFDMSVTSSKQLIGQGFSVPISVGDHFYKNLYASNRTRIPQNISYRLSFRVLSSLSASLGQNKRVEIIAEGTYDSETGALCMIGCRALKIDSLDCDILVNLQFSPVEGRSSNGEIKGSIESLRKKPDPLYFERLDLASNTIYASMERKSLWRIDMEIVMVLGSYTMACIFVALQLFYVKKNHDSLPYISLTMLVVLTIGYVVPLLLNFEAMFVKNHRFDQSNRIFEVIVRIVTMVAFLLQIRLLQVTWAARKSIGDGNGKGLWDAEKKTMYITAILYISGVLLASTQRSKLLGLKSYLGLVLDLFLAPQVMMNMFENLKEKPLSPAFYVGTTLVRMVPHGYDLYRSRAYSRRFDGSYVYADHGEDLYSTVWDVMIPLGGFVLAMIVYLQQRFGGRCFIPWRVGEDGVYDKVPVVSEG